MPHTATHSWTLVARLVALALTVAGALAAARPLAGPPKAEAIREATSNGADYLVRHLDGQGRFDYRTFVDARPERGVEEYNVLRHAGVLYSLAQFQSRSPEPAVREAILRGSRYLLERHVRPVAAQPGTLAVFSLPGEEVKGPHPELKLGGTALGLLALIHCWELDHASVKPEILRALGKFLVSVQEPSGRFHTHFDAQGKPRPGWESAFYPGEAIYALAHLYRIDPDPQWLESAAKGIRYQVQKRTPPDGKSPTPDHWLMLGVEAVFAHRAPIIDQVLSRDEVLKHLVATASGLRRAQERANEIPGLSGSFARSGGVTSTSTALEGLLALHRALPHEDPERPAVWRSIEEGIGFVLRGQVTEGTRRGGFTRAFPRGSDLGQEGTRRSAAHHEVRIDYVQHALSALLAFDAALGPGRGTTRRPIAPGSTARADAR